MQKKKKINIRKTAIASSVINYISRWTPLLFSQLKPISCGVLARFPPLCRVLRRDDRREIEREPIFFRTGVNGEKRTPEKNGKNKAALCLPRFYLAYKFAHCCFYSQVPATSEGADCQLVARACNASFLFNRDSFYLLPQCGCTYVQTRRYGTNEKG